MTVSININGINQLSFPSGVSSATTSDGVTTVTLASSSAIIGTVSVTSTSGNFQVAHGLSTTPTNAFISMTSGGAIWFQTPVMFDATYIYLVGSDNGLTATVTCF